MACVCEPRDRAGRCRCSPIVHRKVCRELSSADLIQVKNWPDPQKNKTKTTKKYVSRPIISVLKHEKNAGSWTENLFLDPRPYQTLEVQERKKNVLELYQFSGEKHSFPIGWGSVFRFMMEETSLECKTQQGWGMWDITYNLDLYSSLIF